MPTPVNESLPYKNLAASGQVSAKPGKLLGIFVAQASATPTIKVWDSAAGSGAVLVNTFTPIAGTWYAMPFKCAVGCFVTISGTVDCTVSFQTGA